MRGVKKMKHEDKLEFISKKLEEENEPLPVSLEKDNVVEMLKGVEIEQKKTARIIPFKRYASVAAALIVIVSAVVFGGKLKDKVSVNADIGEQETAFDDSTELASAGTETSDDYSEIESYFLECHKKAEENFQTYVKGADTTGTMIFEDSKNAYAMPSSDSKSNAANAAYAETNTQVSGVDEADIIKNDGRYLYVVANNEICIVDAKNMKQVSVIDRFVNKDEKSAKQTDIQDIYVSGDTLTAIVSEMTFDKSDTITVYNDVCKTACYPYALNKCKTLICTYDISDKAVPKETETHSQSGSYQTSRMTDGKLYTVSFYGVDVSHDRTESEIKSDCVPRVDGKKIKPSDIKIGTDGDKDKSFVVLTAFDTSGKTDNNSSYAYLGYCDELYATKDNVYITSTEYGGGKSDYAEVTNIASFAVSGEKIAFKSEGKVSGSVDDRYSMDEYNGYFRIVTTDSVKKKDSFVDVSSLYVLDSGLNTVGKLVDIAKNEGVESVRFMGNSAYIITFENTDPLFTVDLTDPTAPKITGQVELPGFSSYLHPIGDDYILGVGYDGDDDGADYSSVKVTLFNVSDPSSPKVSDEVVIKNADTDVNYNPKAFIYYPEKNLAGIPAIVGGDGDTAYGAYYLIGVKDGKLTEEEKLIHKYSEDYSSLFRGTYIANTAYTVSGEGICSFDIDSGKNLSSFRFN